MVAERVSDNLPVNTGDRGASGFFLTSWLLAAEIHSRFFFCFVLPFPSISTSFHIFPPQLETFGASPVHFFSAVLLLSVKLARCLFLATYLQHGCVSFTSDGF